MVSFKCFLILILISEGWQPGIQEGAADWDEEWDKFEDEGMFSEFIFISSLGRIWT